MAYDFEIREGLETTLTITELPFDIDFSTKVHVWLIDDDRHSIGSANGVDAGTPLNIDVEFDVEPGIYDVEVGAKGGDIVYPTQLPERVRVLPVRFKD